MVRTVNLSVHEKASHVELDFQVLWVVGGIELHMYLLVFVFCLMEDFPDAKYML